MAYQQGSIITANTVPDYNSLKAQIAEVFADAHINETALPGAAWGYGQPDLPPNVAPGDIIRASEWNFLFAATRKSGTHQGTSIGDTPASVSVGDDIVAFDGPTGLITTIDNVRTNRHNTNPSQMTITTAGAKLSSVRSAAWESPISHEFTVTFAGYNSARHFFNSGGQIRLASNRSGGAASSQNTAWTTMLADMGTIIFAWDATTRSGSAGTPNAIGFYNLTNSFQTIFNSVPAGLSSDFYRIEVRSSNTFGTTGVLVFRVTYSTTSSISGTLTSLVDERKATGSLVIASPAYQTTSSLDGGGACIPLWTPTGVIRCSGTNVENEQADGCGNTDWIDSGTPVTWTFSHSVCTGGTTHDVSVNQCGETSTTDTGTPCGTPSPSQAPTPTPTSTPPATPAPTPTPAATVTPTPAGSPTPPLPCQDVGCDPENLNGNCGCPPGWTPMSPSGCRRWTGGVWEERVCE